MIESQTLNFDEFDEEIAAVNGRTILLGREEANWKVHTWSYDDVVLQCFQEGGANSYAASGVDDYFSLAIGLPGPSIIRANGLQMNPGQMAILRPGRDIISCSEGVSRYAVLSVPRDRFISLIDAYDPSQTEQMVNGPIGIKVGQERTKGLVTLITALARGHNEDMSIEGHIAQTAVAEQLCGAFVQAALSTPSTGNPNKSWLTRRVVTKVIVDLLNSPEYSSLSIPEMSALAGVPERTFRLICTERFGLSPRRLFMLRQYNNIRRDLLLESTIGNVSQIVSGHGVWEWGRFAVRYRHIFGESPSETLARRKSRRH